MGGCLVSVLVVHGWVGGNMEECVVSWRCVCGYMEVCVCGYMEVRVVTWRYVCSCVHFLCVT